MTSPFASTQGSLFSSDFLGETIVGVEEWAAVSEADLEQLARDLRDIFNAFPTDHPKDQAPNESQTEDDLIWPVLERLGWRDHLRQQNLSPRARADVPDGLLFADAEAKKRANGFPEEWKRYELGLAVVECKRWARPLDRRSGQTGEDTAPSTQMLRYLRRVDDLTQGNLRWGILTNGQRWRLYYQGARSVSEQFFELDLASLLHSSHHSPHPSPPNSPPHGPRPRPDFHDAPLPLDQGERAHWLKVFYLLFRKAAFQPAETHTQPFHARALDEGRFYEERVTENLSNLVFGTVFPLLGKAIADQNPDASLEDVRDAALVFLYRLLFIIYAEDRHLLPVQDSKYDDYSLREKVRNDVKRRKDTGDTFSLTSARYWSVIDDLCRAIDQGDASIGLPPYNGGLFERARTPLLSTTRLGDQVVADIIDALSFEQTPDGRRYINYRDLSVQQLGSIYERLLEYEITRDRNKGGDGAGAGDKDSDSAGARNRNSDSDALIVRPNIFARKGSGSYYTPDDLVSLIIRETVGPLVVRQMDAFRAAQADLEKEGFATEQIRARLSASDPAEGILNLKVCDPAMGSGHFLVSLVDYLADHVIAAIAEAEALVEGYRSPLSGRIERIRETIWTNALEKHWSVRAEQLDDRHIVRRMVLKRCVYGVDKNPMAVELAKVSLWLHTFTVGAPLSFLDHHLCHGDSLFGAWVRDGLDRVAAHGALFLNGPIQRAMSAARGMDQIEHLTDAEIDEAHQSAEIFEEVRAKTAPLDALLSLFHAFDWLDIKDKEEKAALNSFFDGQFGNPDDIALSLVSDIQRAQGAQAGQGAQGAQGGQAVHGGQEGQETQAVQGIQGSQALPEGHGVQGNSPAATAAAQGTAAANTAQTTEEAKIAAIFNDILARARALIREESFLNWQVAFPGVWTDWKAANAANAVHGEKVGGGGVRRIRLPCGDRQPALGPHKAGTGGMVRHPQAGHRHGHQSRRAERHDRGPQNIGRGPRPGTGPGL